MVLRTRVRGGKIAPLVLPPLVLAPLLACVLLALASERTGFQDIGALMAQRPAVSARWRDHLAATSSGLMQAAVFSFPRLIGANPQNIVLASLSPPDLPVVDPVPPLPEFAPRPPLQQADRVERSRKGDLQVPWVQVEIMRAALAVAPEAIAETEGGETDEIEAAAAFEPFPEYDISMSFDMVPQTPDRGDEAAAAEAAAPDDTADGNIALGTAGLYFGAAPLGAAPGRVTPWPEGEAPVLAAPATAVAPTVDAAPAPVPTAPTNNRAEPKVETVPARPLPLSPAARLRLVGASRAKAERCLANAVYFEARGEAVRGQVAVAQVVLNRAFSGYYPNDVCGVVYQGANRHLSCQFTFACDGIPDVVTEEEPWSRAKRVAKAALDGKVWLEDVGKATHYHAAFVNPYWVRSMRKLQRIGVHTFYRPRRWGNGADAPSWGTPVVRGGELVARL